MKYCCTYLDIKKVVFFLMLWFFILQAFFQQSAASLASYDSIQPQGNTSSQNFSCCTFSTIKQSSLAWNYDLKNLWKNFHFLVEIQMLPEIQFLCQ